MDTLICNFDIARYLIFSNNVFGVLIYYSHLLPFFTSLFIGYLIIKNDTKSLLNRILVFILLNFSIWIFLDLILWANEKSQIIMFSWSIMVLFEVLIYASSFYFLYVFIQKKDLSFKYKMLIGILISPVILLLGTKLNIIGYDATNCNREVIEGFISTIYVYFVEISLVISILYLAIRSIVKEKTNFKIQIAIISTGLILFLVAFSWGNIAGSITDNWNFGQWGLIGAPVFVAFLAYMIVRFHTFNVKLLGAQALVLGLWLLVFGILFIRNIGDVRIITIFTLALVSIAGYLLVKSVKKEVEQKEQLAKLNIDLQNVIQQRESLMHLINHKVKGSFTHTKYIFAGMLDGMFGTITPEIKKIALLGMSADEEGIRTIDLILNTANLQKGTVKYEMKSIDLKELITKTVEEKKTQAEKKGIKIETEITGDVCMINGDSFWLKEVVNNLIDNSIRYTKEGEIRVGLKKENSKLLFYVKDTGIGITPEDKNNLFTEGGRGKESVKTNVDSTGYGLFTVKLIVEAHSGKVWVESEGEGKGSTFFVQFDAI